MIRVLAALMLFLFPVAAIAQPAGAPQVSEAWLRLSPLKDRPTAGYFVIKGGAADDRLIGASANFAKRVELHAMQDDKGIMKMISIDSVAVPAGGSVQFAPGGRHLMLFGLAPAPAKGSKAMLTLTFQKAGKVNVPFEVRGIEGKTLMKVAPHGDHDMADMHDHH